MYYWRIFGQLRVVSDGFPDMLALSEKSEFRIRFGLDIVAFPAAQISPGLGFF